MAVRNQQASPVYQQKAQRPFPNEDPARFAKEVGMGNPAEETTAAERNESPKTGAPGQAPLPVPPDGSCRRLPWARLRPEPAGDDCGQGEHPLQWHLDDTDTQRDDNRVRSL